MEKLAAYIETCGMSQRQLADKWGIHHAMLSKYKRGLVRPGIDAIFKIQRLSGGKVPADAWETPAP